MQGGVSLTKTPKTITANSQWLSLYLPCEAACSTETHTESWTGSQTHRTLLQSLCHYTQPHSYMPHNPAMTSHSSRDWTLTGVVREWRKDRQTDTWDQMVWDLGWRNLTSPEAHVSICSQTEVRSLPSDEQGGKVITEKQGGRVYGVHRPRRHG